MKSYDHTKIEKKWQKEWEAKKIYTAQNSSKQKKFYGLIEFPYPSGAGLHVGHIRSNTAMDIIARKRRMEGHNVLYPIGWDAFGLPTENYAIKTGIQPAKVTKDNTDMFRKQLKALGFSFDWSREVNTTDPAYYKWTQWIFLQMYKKGLAYKAKTEINWCPKDKIGLANEEAAGGVCERCGGPTEKRLKEQWMLAITKYADRLDKDLDDVNYLEKIKIQQRNWIGRSEGSEIEFAIKNNAGNVIIVHGSNKDESSSKIGKLENMRHWKPWIKKQLENAGFSVSNDLYPEDWKPDYIAWKKVFEKNDIDENTTLIGHSAGTAFLLRWLSENKRKINKLILIAPSLLKSEKYIRTSKLKDFTYDSSLKKYFNEIIIFYSNNDHPNMIASAKEAHTKLGGKLILLENRGHFVLEHMGSEEFPELLAEIVPKIKVFTTRADTLFGATYVVLAPEHELVQKLKPEIKNFSEVEKYLSEVKKKDELERTAENKEKTGVELKGIKAINPANGEEIPVWIADYVLASYGTGAVMAVPAHDERDFEFANRYDLLIKQTVVSKNLLKSIVVAPTLENELAFKTELRKLNISFDLSISAISKREHIRVTLNKENLHDFISLVQKYIKKDNWVEILGNENIIVLKKEIQSDFFNHATEWFVKFREWEPFVRDQKNLWCMLAKNSFLNELVCYKNDGILVHSGKFNGLSSEEARKKITEAVGGKMVTKFKLRDWVFSRQRYWGEPIPLIFCDDCGEVPVPEKDLPVVLPKVKSYAPTDTGESPLANISAWVNVKCPKCKGKAKRETDTMPNWAGSSWYFLRYVDPKNKKEFASKKSLEYWMDKKSGGIDWYNGGMEHTTLHLLYSRFWHKFLFDLKLVPTSEPYMKRTSHGMILAEGGDKMSKSKGNVVNPDDIVKTYGADTLRLYEMFMGPFDQAVVWSTESMIGPRRFIEKVFRIAQKPSLHAFEKEWPRTSEENRATEQKHQARLLHKTIKKVSEDIETMSFNTCVSSMMILAGEMEKAESVSRDDFKKFLQILAPFAPHIAEELWRGMGEKKSIHLSAWPEYDAKLIVDDEIKIAVQVNGKVRGEMLIAPDTAEADVRSMALHMPKVIEFLGGEEPKKVIYVKNRLINIVR